jgi:hypothetical protein
MLEINKVDITTLERSNIHNIKLSKPFKNISILNNYSFVHYKDNTYLLIVNKSGAEFNGKVGDTDIRLSQENDQAALFNKKTSNLEILEMKTNTISKIGLSQDKDIKAIEVISDETGFYVFYKKNLIFVLERIEKGALVKVTEFMANNISLGSKMFFVNKYAINNSEGMKGFLNQSSFNVEASKLITFFTDESETFEDYHYTPVESIYIFI